MTATSWTAVGGCAMSATTLDLESPQPLAHMTGANAILSVLRFGLDPIAEMRDVHRAKGPLVEFSFNGLNKRRYVLAVGAKYNKRVLSDPTTFRSIGVMLPGPKNSAQRRISSGLLGPSGDNHTHYRRLLLSPLRRDLDKMANTIAEVVDREISAWPVGAPVELFALCKSVTQKAALQTLFSTESGSCSDEIVTAARLIDEHIALEAAPTVRGLPINVPGFPYHRMLRHAEAVEAALTAWVRKEGAPPRPGNLMCELANSPDETGAPPGDRAVLNHLPTVLAAAYETCQTALTWALFLLAQSPSASASLLEDLSALPDEPEGFLKSQLLDFVTRESARLLPSVPTQTRRTGCDTDLVDCQVAKGAYVVLSAFLTNREPDLFGEPERFLPSRWESVCPTQYEYLVFSAGPRTCIGSWYASTFLRVAIARIAKRFRVQVAPGARIDHKVRLTFSPGRGGIPVILHPQDGRFQASPITGSVCEIVRFDAEHVH